MNISDLTLHNILDTTSQIYHYYIPNYQREYAWKKEHCEQLLEDIQENPIGHFMGSLITLKQNTDHGADQIYDVVDGQQRLTTLSLLLMVIYSKYVNFDDGEVSDRKVILNLDILEKYLIRVKPQIPQTENSYILDNGVYKFLRVKPTTQNNNLADYLYLLYDIGLLEDEPEYPDRWGSRRLVNTFRFFDKQIIDEKEVLEDLLVRIQNLKFILINADDPSMAYRMFETLNNRGVPLSPVDIIKNQILSKLATPDQGKLNDEYAFKKWKILIQYLPEDIQIRFFRHFFNVYQFEEIEGHLFLQTKGLTKATQSNITLAFKNAISKDPNLLLELLTKRAKIYYELLNPEFLSTSSKKVKDSLSDLAKIGAAPAYASLMLLWENKLNTEDFGKIVDFYVKFFIRRNLTDVPPTRDLDTIQVEICKKIFQKIYDKEEITSEWFISNLMVGRAEPLILEELKKSLHGQVYSDNRDIIRYLLIKIEETHHNREYKPNLWERNEKNKYLWTIEHVLPQDENLKPFWTEMLEEDGDDAYEVWYDYVDTIGNLSLSAYNSKLSNSALTKKQAKQSANAHGNILSIGYKNGLYLNNLIYKVEGKEYSLATTSVWNKKHIIARGERLIEEALALLKFEGE